MMPTCDLIRGDALSVLADMDSDSVHALVTDPPYNSPGSQPNAPRTRSARTKYVSSDAKHALADFPGENRDQRGYLRWLTEVLTESYRLTADHGIAVVFSDWRQGPLTTDALQMAGWTWSGTLPWIKPTCRPRRGGFRQAAEFAHWAVKGKLDASREVYLPGYFQASQPRKGRVHITQKPVEMMRELVRACPEGGTVLDPFMGSGTTGEAALLEGRRFVGIEMTEHYHAVAEARLRGAERELTQDDFVLAAPEA